MAVLGFLNYVMLFSLLANCVFTLSVVNVRDHGVVGDGIADDTQVRAQIYLNISSIFFIHVI